MRSVLKSDINLVISIDHKVAAEDATAAKRNVYKRARAKQYSPTEKLIDVRQHNFLYRIHVCFNTNITNSRLTD